MLIKVLFVVIAFCVMWRWALGKWPWDALRAPSARDKALQQARTLLGVAEGAGREDIITAHRRLTALVHPDKGGTTAAMQEANAARDLLLSDLPAGPMGLGDDDADP